MCGCHSSMESESLDLTEVDSRIVASRDWEGQGRRWREKS